MNPTLDRAAIVDALEALDRELRKQGRRTGRRTQIYVYGGACVSLSFDRSRVTGDIDVHVREEHGAVQEAILKIARERAWPTTWMNEQGTQKLPRTTDQRARVLYQSAHLVVTGASAEHIIAMKMRVGRDIDWEDIERVAKHRDIESASELERIHDAVFPGEALPLENQASGVAVAGSGRKHAMKSSAAGRGGSWNVPANADRLGRAGARCQSPGTHPEKLRRTPARALAGALELNCEE